MVNGKPGDLMLENITALTMAAFQLVAVQRGPHWNVDVDDAESIARPVTNILLSLPSSAAKQAQKIMNTVAAPLALFGAASGIIVLRMKMDAEIQARVDIEVARTLANRGGNNGIPAPETQNRYTPETEPGETRAGQGSTDVSESSIENEAGIESLRGVPDAVSTGGR